MALLNRAVVDRHFEYQQPSGRNLTRSQHPLQFVVFQLDDLINAGETSTRWQKKSTIQAGEKKTMKY